jgi:hypothetical protein
MRTSALSALRGSPSLRRQITFPEPAACAGVLRLLQLTCTVRRVAEACGVRTGHLSSPRRADRPPYWVGEHRGRGEGGKGWRQPGRSYPPDETARSQNHSMYASLFPQKCAAARRVLGVFPRRGGWWAWIALSVAAHHREARIREGKAGPTRRPAARAVHLRKDAWEGGVAA